MSVRIKARISDSGFAMRLILGLVSVFSATAAAQERAASSDPQNPDGRLPNAEAEIEPLQESPAAGSGQGVLHVAVPNAPVEDSEARHWWHEFPGVVSGENYPSLDVHGAFQVDSAWFDQDAASRASVGNIRDGGSFRRARLSASGAISPVMDYRFEMDFAWDSTIIPMPRT